MSADIRISEDCWWSVKGRLYEQFIEDVRTHYSADEQLKAWLEQPLITGIIVLDPERHWYDHQAGQQLYAVAKGIVGGTILTRLRDTSFQTAYI